MERLQRWFGGGGGGDSGQPKPAKDNLAVGRPLLAESTPVTTATATSAKVTPAKTAPSPTSLKKLESELPDIPSDTRVTETTVCYSSIPLVLRISSTNAPNHTFEFDRCSLFIGWDGKHLISDLTVMFTPSLVVMDTKLQSLTNGIVILTLVTGTAYLCSVVRLSTGSGRLVLW